MSNERSEEAVKQQEQAVDCRCACHRNPNVTHAVPCCNPQLAQQVVWEMDKAIDDVFLHGTGVLKVEHVPYGEFTPPPSVPVVAEVVASLRNAALLYKDGSCARSNLISAALLVEHVAAQQPAAQPTADEPVDDWEEAWALFEKEETLSAQHQAGLADKPCPYREPES